jgi:hypothetical protein
LILFLRIESWTQMRAGMLGKILVTLIVMTITLPSDEDGVFGSVFLDSPPIKSQVSVKKKAVAEDTLSEPEFLGVDESATFVRNRCDFCDLVFESSYGHKVTPYFYFSTLSRNRGHFISSLLSDFLLSLPPPTT